MEHRGPVLLLAFVAVLSGMLVAVAAGAQAPAEDPQAKEWQAIQQMLTKEHGICLEHCGGSASCENHCGKAHTTKMNREHNRLFGKPMPTADKSGY